MFCLEDDGQMSDDMRKQVHYASRRLHRLGWTEGSSRYCKECIMYHIKHKFPQWQSGTFYVMDAPNGRKLNFLKETFPLLNLVEYPGATFKSLPEPRYANACPHRDHGKRCAFLKCQRLCTHYLS